MSPDPSPGFATDALPPDVWLWGGLTIVLTAVIAFVAGVRYERGASRRALARARKSLARLVDVVFHSLENAQQACRLLEQFPNASLSTSQMQQLERKQTRLLETVTTIVEEQRERAAQHCEPDLPASEPVAFDVSWQREPVDKKTGLPDRSAFDGNLQGMLETGSEASGQSGLLLVRVDKFDQMRSRYGSLEADTLIKKLSGAILRSARDEDLLCRFAGDSFGLLMPNLTAETGRRLSHAVREAVRHSHFHLKESGPEVLVTASFGFTSCHPGDTPELVLSRAENALDKSQRRGRNQLHVHDGKTVVHCLAG